MEERNSEKRAGMRGHRRETAVARFPRRWSLYVRQETGQTFKEYLTEIRIKKAKELLRMTGLRSADIGYRVGYNDPHYFSSVFKKHTGLSPIEFRSQI